MGACPSACPSSAPGARRPGPLASALAGPRAAAWVAIAFFLLGVALIGALSLELPAAGAQSLLVFAPGTSQAEAIGRVAAAGGRLVDAGGIDGLVIAIFDRDLGWGELHAMGAWAAFPPDSLLGCLAAEMLAT